MADDKSKKCETCRWWRNDRGVFTATGWTGTDGDDGHCHYEVKRVSKVGGNVCHHWDQRQSGDDG